LDNSYQPAIITEAKQNSSQFHNAILVHTTKSKKKKKKIPSIWEARIRELFQENNREKP
jgi:hypothetical protein